MSTIKSAIEQISKNFTKDLEKISTIDELEAVRIQYLGRNGKIADLMTRLKELSIEEKRDIGPLLNTLKESTQTDYQKRKVVLESQLQEHELAKSKDFDVTAYKPMSKGSLHPYTHLTNHVENIFISMGFMILDGPEVETPFYNFEALNIPEDHPARDMHDTFWLQMPGYLLRTHTSSVQIHALQDYKLPIAVCAPGRVYRHEATDATHDFVFRQIEGLVVDKNISVAHLVGLLKVFLQALFARSDIKLRVRPSFFPFVEPGLEIDISCPFCKNGCSVCKKRTWIEMGGAGLVHPNVLRSCNIDPEIWSGMAFGMGLERLAMLKYHINDIRLLKSGRIDFLNQF